MRKGRKELGLLHIYHAGILYDTLHALVYLLFTYIDAIVPVLEI